MAHLDRYSNAAVDFLSPTGCYCSIAPQGYCGELLPATGLGRKRGPV